MIRSGGLVRVLAAAVLACGLCQCRTAGFYAQAALGQGEILRRARPLEEVRRDRRTKPEVRAGLEVATRLRRFARDELGLPAAGQYHRYTDLGREHAVWVVFAAPEFELTLRKWRYPLVGGLAYRGYFAERPARAEAGRLREAGFDTHVSGVPAFSSLGWFSDPLLNTFIRHDPPDLAELLFHELAHQRLFLKGDTDFNEALATCVGREGARRWLRAEGRLADLAVYERRLGLLDEFLDLVRAARGELEAVYGNDGLSSAEKRQAREVVFGRLRARCMEMQRASGGSVRFERFFSQPVNNARLLALGAYHDLVPRFDELLRRCDGDLERFFEAAARGRAGLDF